MSWLRGGTSSELHRIPMCSRFQRQHAIDGRAVTFGRIEWKVAGHVEGCFLSRPRTSSATESGSLPSLGTRTKTWKLLSVVMNETTNSEGAREDATGVGA